MFEWTDEWMMAPCMLFCFCSAAGEDDYDGEDKLLSPGPTVTQGRRKAFRTLDNGDEDENNDDADDGRDGEDECHDCDHGDDCFVCSRFRTEPTSLRSTVRFAPDPSSTEQGISCSANVLSCSPEPCGKSPNQPESMHHLVHDALSTTPKFTTNTFMSPVGLSDGVPVLSSVSAVYYENCVGSLRR